MTDKKQPEESKIFAISLQSGKPFTPSPRLQEMLNSLSAQQASGVIRIAEGELRGLSMAALLHGPNKICSYSTFYAKERGGWMHKPKFVAALELARAEVRSHGLTSVVGDAVERLKLATLDAATDLHRQITGDVGAIAALGEIVADKKRPNDERIKAAHGLGEIGSQAAVDQLLMALSAAQAKTEVGLRTAIVEELGKAGAATNTRRRLADMATLDRADKMTASKGPGERTAEELSDEELEAIARESTGSGDRTAAPTAGAATPD